MADHIPVSFHHIRTSRVPLALRIFFIIFLPETAYAAVLALFLNGGNISVFGMVVSLWVAHTVVFLVVCVGVLAVVLDWAATIYYLDEHHLTKYSGVMRNDERVYELKSIRSVSRHQTWLGKALNYGDLEVLFGASGYREELTLRNIVDPHTYERIFTSNLGVEAREYLTPVPKA